MYYIKVSYCRTGYLDWGSCSIYNKFRTKNFKKSTFSLYSIANYLWSKMAVLIRPGSHKGREGRKEGMMPWHSNHLILLIWRASYWSLVNDSLTTASLWSWNTPFLSKLHYNKKYEAPRKLSKTKPPFSGISMKTYQGQGYTVNHKYLMSLVSICSIGYWGTS